MNIQEIYDKVARHLLAQGMKSQAAIADPETKEVKINCAYRGDNGLMCAVGCLISENVYSKSIEGYSCRNDMVMNALIESGISVDFEIKNLLLNLQQVHDDINPSGWKDYLNDIAIQYCLEPLKD